MSRELLPSTTELTTLSLLSALRLASSALPIGAFAYSQALEQAVALGNVHDADSAERWISGLLESSLLTLDVPLLMAFEAAWAAHELGEVRRLSELVHAQRATHELREEERQLGAALFRLLSELGCERALPFARTPRASLLAAFALAATSFGIPRLACAASYCFAWSEAQVAAATRLVPLGQSAAQRVLSKLLAVIDAGLPSALTRAEADVTSTTQGQSLFSALHETEYSRLFRS